jgi:hypothetical protein
VAVATSKDSESSDDKELNKLEQLLTKNPNRSYKIDPNMDVEDKEKGDEGSSNESSASIDSGKDSDYLVEMDEEEDELLKHIIGPIKKRRKQFI